VMAVRRQPWLSFPDVKTSSRQIRNHIALVDLGQETKDS
jgi:hypothetical protein